MQKGFTLLEIIIVMAILLSLLGFATFNYARYAEERKLTRDVQLFATMVQLARARAVNGDTDVYACGDFQGYQVDYTASAANSYTLTLCCNATCSTTDPGSRSYQLQQSVFQTNIAPQANMQIRFKPFARGTVRVSGTTTLPDTDNLTVVLKNSFINKCNWVTVTGLGVIDSGKLYDC